MVIFPFTLACHSRCFFNSLEHRHNWIIKSAGQKFHIEVLTGRSRMNAISIYIYITVENILLAVRAYVEHFSQTSCRREVQAQGRAWRGSSPGLAHANFNSGHVQQIPGIYSRLTEFPQLLPRKTPPTNQKIGTLHACRGTFHVRDLSCDDIISQVWNSKFYILWYNRWWTCATPFFFLLGFDFIG